MARGGHRQNAGRQSNWVSSSQTKAIRVPEWMVDELLIIAKKLDLQEHIENVQKQNESVPGAVERLTEIVDRWEASIPLEKQKAPRWQKAYELVQELSDGLRELREGG